MSSISAFEYRRYCATYIEEAMARPRMYYRDLASLEQILHGHSVAFSQLGVVEKREEMFNHAFAAWLRRSEGASVASGWSHACLALASRAGQDAERLFAVQVRDFLRQWTDNEAS